MSSPSRFNLPESSLETSGTFNSNERRIIFLTSLGHTLCHVSEMVFAAVIVAVMLEFRLAPDQATWLAVPGFVLFGVGAVPAGLWTDHRGSHEVLTTYFFLVAIASLAVAMVRNPVGLALALATLGIAISLYHPAGLAMLSHGCRQRGRAMGINGIAGSMGVALGPYLGLYAVSQDNWRMAYWVIAIVSGISGFLSLLIRIHTHSTRSNDPDQAPAVSRRDGGTSLRALVLLYLAMLLGGVNYRSMTTALPTLLSGESETAAAADVGPQSSGDSETVKASPVARGHVDKWKSELVLVVLALGGLGQLIGGYAADKLRSPMMYTLFIALTIPMALFMAHGSEATTALAAVVLCVFLFAQQPVENMMVAEATPAKWRSTSYGLKFILTFGVGALGAQVAGVIWKHAGLATVFDVFAIAAFCMAIVAGLYWASHTNERKVPGTVPTIS